MNSRFFSIAAALCGIAIALATPSTSSAASVGIGYQRGLGDLSEIHTPGEGGFIAATSGITSFVVGAQFFDKGVWTATAEVGAHPYLFGTGLFVGADFVGVVYHDAHASTGVAKTRVRPGLFLPIGWTSYFEGRESALDIQVGIGFTPSRGESHWYPGTEAKVRLTYKWIFGSDDNGSSAPQSRRMIR